MFNKKPIPCLTDQYSITILPDSYDITSSCNGKWRNPWLQKMV